MVKPQVDPCVIRKCFCNGLHITCVPLEGRDTKIGPSQQILEMGDADC